MDGSELKQLYPYLYYVGAQKTIFTFDIYLAHTLYALVHSLLTFYVPLWAIHESGIMNENGHSADFWLFSFTSFTCLYTAVTVRICVWTRWWTCVNFVFYSFLSILVYIIYIWGAEFLKITQDIFMDLRTVHATPIFWLTLLFITGFTLVLDAAIEFLRLHHYKNASDYMREYIRDKMNSKDYHLVNEVKVSKEDIEQLEKFIEPIKAEWRQ